MLPPQLGHYRLLDKLGEGGMGVVYKAQDLRLDRIVALKILPPDRVADQDRKLRFIQEAKAASALNHPNIVTIHEIGQDQGMDFLVMEWINGQTLEQLLPATGLRVPELLRLAVQIADGIAAAHAAGVAHRDIKPSNMMVSGAGHVKILDFGLAKLSERGESSADEKTRPASPHTSEGAILGTVAYMSPEQAEGRKVDLRTDIFSFGTLLYEMACGRRAFAGETPASTLGAVIHKEPRPLGELAPELPVELRRLIERCLRKDRTRRLQSMADVKVALLDLKEESDSGRLSVAPAAVIPPRRRGWLLPVACAGALLAGIAGTLAWTGRASKNDGSFDPVLTQLTRDSGLTYQPALSPDGKLLAYASNRSDPANLDIWVQQLAGGQPVRLTSHAVADTRPLFSPDGTVIYFHSDRPEGSIWAIPALGGEERLVYNGHDVMNILLSPDGTDLIFNRRIQMGEAAHSSRISTLTGAIRPLASPLPSFFPFAWSDDGQTLIGIGRHGAFTTAIADGAIYAAPLQGGAATLFQLPSGEPLLWNGRGVRLRDSRLFLSEADSLLEYSVARSWKVKGPLRRWARFPGFTLQFDVAGQAIVAATLSSVTDLWSLPMRANEGKVTGPPERLTNDEATDWWPSLSGSARTMLFTSDRRGNREVWARDIVTGKESQATATPDAERRATISPDGRKMAYEVSGAVASIFVRDVAGGEPKPVCKACGLPTWTPDSARVVYWDGEPIRFHTFDVASGERKLLVSHPKLAIQGARISPDGQWVAFHLPERQLSRIYLARLHGGSAGPATEWIEVSAGRESYNAWWAPDGNLLYFLAGRTFDGIYAQRLDAASKRPSGDPFLVFTPPPGFAFSNVGVAGFSMAEDRMVLSMQQSKSNLWKIASPATKP